MRLFKNQTEKLNQEDIKSLLENEVSESRNLDYKQEFKVSSEQDKKEFLADICSFANSGGGFLIYGISEKSEDGKNTGLPDKLVGLESFNADTEVRRIDESIRKGIQPTIIGTKYGVVEGFEKGPVFVIEIPKSWASPHMVTYKGASRFYARSSANKYQMDVTEIKSSFLNSESFSEKIKSFRLDRLSAIKAGDTPQPVENGALLVLHIFSIESFFSNDSFIDIESVKGKTGSLAPMSTGSGWSHRINYDGFCTYSKLSYENSNPAFAYTQIYRSGRIEAVDSLMFTTREKMIPSQAYEEDLVKSTKRYVEILENEGVPGPYSINISLLGVKGFELGVSRISSPFHENNHIEKEDLLLPEVEANSSTDNFYEILRPVFDLVWNSCGYQRSYNYDDNGQWSPNRR